MASDPVLNAISANGANLSNSASDLSVSTMTNIFGDGWWNLIDAAKGGSGGNAQFIYSLLETLNSCCAIVVAWLMIFTVLIASVGSAQEGRSIGGQYASAWVPLRFSFSFAAITPVFNGLCALQILILACIGVSIDLANTMYMKGIKWISENRTVSAASPPKLTGIGQQLAVGAVESQVLINYLSSQAGCSGLSETNLVAHTAGTDIIYLFQVPETLNCGGYNIKVKPNALGGFKISNANPSLAAKRQNAIAKMVSETKSLAEALGKMKPDYQQYNKILKAGETYGRLSFDAALADLNKQNQTNLQKANKSFQDVAQTQGWFSLGSYYWTIANAAQTSMDAMSDNTSYIKPNLDDFRVALHNSWDMNVQRNLLALQEVANNPINLSHAYEYDAASAVSSHDGLGSIGKYFHDFEWDSFGSPPDSGNSSYAADASSLISGPDAIISTVQLARKVVNICTASMIAVEAAKLTAIGMGEAAKDSWIGKILSVGTGANSGVGEALKQGAKDVAWLVMLSLGSLWVYATFIAYIVPAMPFLIWLAAIVGWVVLCLEAIIAAPLWLIGHAMPEGAGFAGQHGRTGYMLVLSILVRPILLVISMFLAMIIMQATGSLISALFTPFTVSMKTFGGWFNGIGPVGCIFLFILLSGTIMMFTWKIFELVTAMPDRLIRWVGQNVQNLGDEGRQAMSNQVIGSTSRQGQKIENIAGAVSGGRRGLHQRFNKTNALAQGSVKEKSK